MEVRNKSFGEPRTQSHSKTAKAGYFKILLASMTLVVLNIIAGFLSLFIAYTLFMNFLVTVSFTSGELTHAYRVRNGIPADDQLIANDLYLLARYSLMFYYERDRLPADVEELASYYKGKPAINDIKYFKIDTAGPRVVSVLDPTVHSISLKGGMAEMDLKKLMVAVASYYFENSSIPENVGALKKYLSPDRIKRLSVKFFINKNEKVIIVGQRFVRRGYSDRHSLEFLK